VLALRPREPALPVEALPVWQALHLAAWVPTAV